MQLREYQQRADEHLRARYAAGDRRLCLVAPTGSGKTAISAHWLRRAVARNYPALFVAGRRQVIEQTHMRLIVTFGLPKDQVAILMARHKLTNPEACVQVTCTDTLARRTLQREPRLVVLDEVHMDRPKWQPIVEQWPAATVIGLTATPTAGLGEFFDGLVTCSSVAELTELGYLARARCFSVPEDSQPDLRAVPLEGDDFAPEPLARAVDTRRVVGDCVEHWRRYAAGRPTLLFAVDIRNAEHAAARFNEAGVPFGVLHSRMTTAARGDVLLRFKSGELRGIASVDCLSEGFDEPAAKCAILLRPTEVFAKHAQQVGRVLRPHLGQTAVILDPVGNLARHGLPTDEQRFELTTGTTRREGVPALQTCPSCFAVFEPAEACPVCGEKRLPRPGRRMKRVDGELVEVTESKTQRCDPTPAEYREQLRRQSWAVYPDPSRFEARRRFIDKRMRERFPREAA